MKDSKYWRAVNKRVDWLVKHKGWDRKTALANTRSLFKTNKFWRQHYETIK